ncbi:eukaryotic translation initiation factor 2-alpha kinase 3-like [Montipora foliosa]|uniref:eukaryotic translation initiation factor 2-alpha kinase 3-like n=1 Tax=Montipora foliosa TaxID=591990 RepID=UPI0035F1C080
MNIFHASASFVVFMATFVVVNGKLDGEKASGLSARRSSCSLVVVSTLDGKVSALDTKDNGKLLWTLPPFHGPLLSSSLSSIEMAKHVGLIPSLDGGLYQVEGDKVEPIPFTADSLLGSFYKLPDGSILVGGKEATSCGINPSSGTVRYVCSADGCHLTETGEGHIQGGDVLVLKRIQQTIRAVDQRTGMERWNFSVGQHDISFLEAILSDSGDCHCSAKDEEGFVNWNLRVSIPNGLVAAVHSQGSKETEVVLWSHQFEAPVAAVWRLSGGYIQPVTLLSREVMPELVDSSSRQTFPQGPVLYVGKHEGQVYIQTSDSFNPAQDEPARIGDVKGNTALQKKRQQVAWRPYLTSSPSRTPTVVTKDLAVWSPLEYPFDNGYYFYGEVMPVIPPHTCKKDQTILPVGSVGRDDRNSSETTVAKPDSSSWWYGSVLVTVIVVVVFQFLLRFLGILKKKNCDALQLQRIPSNGSSLASSSSLETLMGPPSPATPSTLTPTNSFISRYLTDFEHELCLGKGGFGVVFQAKNKLDDCQYAIKRIRLPNCDEALEKVRREVKALAKLEHHGIVRYYNSWFEAPPVGWQDEVDAKMYEEGSFCGLPSEVPSFGSGIVLNAGSTDEMSAQNDLQHKVGRRRKKTSSGSRSRHSSHSSSHDNILLKETEDGESIDIHQLENEAFLEGHEVSDSFSIEFASSSNQGLTFKENGFNRDLLEDSASHSIVFRDSDASQAQDISNIGALSCEDVENSNSKETETSEEMHFTSSHHSLLSREKHKCQNKNCSSDRVSAPLYLFIQMQLCKRQSLKDWLKCNHERNHVFCLTVFEQILCAVEYFHGRGLMHRDLKPSNIFFSLDGSVKVGDFGLVTAHSSENNMDIPLADALMVDKNHTSQVGTQLYMSPEQVEGKAYSHKVDIFSLGLIFFELFCPFGTQMERIKVMCGVKQRVIPRDFASKMPIQSELVQWLLSASPKARPNATEVKNSDILKQIKLHENGIIRE